MESCSSRGLLHSFETFLGGLLSFLRLIGVVHGGLETASNVVRVLVGIVPASRAKVARIEDLRNHYHDVNQEKGVINSHRDYVAWTPQKYWDC